MYELKKLERYLRVNLLRPGPRLMEKSIYLATVSQRLRNTGVEVVIRITSSAHCTRPASRLPKTPASTSSAENHTQ